MSLLLLPLRRVPPAASGSLIRACAAACILSLAGCKSDKLAENNLVGTWVVESTEMEGRPLKGKVAKNIEVVIASPDVITFVTDGEKHEGTCAVDTNGWTWEKVSMTITPVAGNSVDKPLYVRYAVNRKGQELVLCLSKRRYPPEFATYPGYDYVLLKLIRKSD